MKDRRPSASTQAPRPMPMPMGMHADASTSMSMSMSMPMNVPVVSAPVPMHASVPVHAWSYAYCRGSAHVLHVLSAIGLHARPIASAPRPMSAAIIMTMTMIVPVSAYDAAADCSVIAGRSLSAGIFHDARVCGYAPASMLMLMLMLTSASTLALVLAAAAAAALAPAPMVMSMHASMPMPMPMPMGMPMGMLMRMVIAGSAPLPSSAHTSHHLMRTTVMDAPALLCGSLHSAAAPFGGASAFMNRFRTMGSVMRMRDDAGVMGGVREPEQCADGIIRR